MFRTALVPLDGSLLAEGALPHAEVLATQLRTKLKLLRVVPTRRRGGAAPMDIVDRPLCYAEAMAYLDAVAADLATREVEAEVEVSVGQPAERILDAVRATAPDLVILTSHGSGGPSPFAMGSVAQKVLSRAGTSVLIVPNGLTPPGGSEGYRRVLVGLDCTAHGGWALNTGVALARATGAELVLTHIVAVPRAAGPRPVPAELAQAVDRVVSLNRAAAEAFLADTVASIAGRDLNVRVRIDVAPSVPDALADVAEHEHADLVVLAAHGASLDVREQYGSVAAQVLPGIRWPLLVAQDTPRPSAPLQEAAPARLRREPPLRNQ